MRKWISENQLSRGSNPIWISTTPGFSACPTRRRCSMTGTGATDPVVVSDHPDRRSEDLQSRRACTVRVLPPTGPMTFTTYHPHPSRFPEKRALDYARLADRCETQKKMRFPLLVRFATEAMRLG